MTIDDRSPSKRGSRPKPPVGKRSSAAPYGTDRAVSVEKKGRGRLAVSYWDLWMVVLADREFDADLDRLAEEMRAQRDRRSVTDLCREEWKGRLSHLRDLQLRLQAAGLDLTAVMEAAGPLARQEVRWARRKVLEEPARQAEYSEPMRWTPEKKECEFALRGHWDDFPVSPRPYAEEIAANFNGHKFYRERESFSVSRRLDRYVTEAKKLAGRRQPAEALALLRAVLTKTIHVMGFADDSCGVIGNSFQSAFREYLALDPVSTGIDETVFLHDLLMLLIWEDYGLTYRQTDGHFGKLSREQGQICLDFLRQQTGHLKAEDLDYQAQKALTLLGQVASEQGRFELFISLAREMKSDHWRRILLLADAAVKGRKRDLAMLVFEAALQLGPHYDYLRSYYEQLQCGVWKPDLKR